MEQQGASLERRHDAIGVVKMAFGSVAAGFAFGEVTLATVEATLAKDDAIVTTATLCAERVGTTGVGVVTALLLSTSSVISLGTGFLLAAVAITLLTKISASMAWLADYAAGVSVAAGAVAAGVLGGVIPPWLYVTSHCVMLVAVYAHSNVNEVATSLLIIFATFYLSVTYGRMGLLLGLFAMGITVAALCALRRALAERLTGRSRAKKRSDLLESVQLYSLIVVLIGFPIGLGCRTTAGTGSEAEVSQMLESVLWMLVMSAVLIGAAMGTVAVVGLGIEGAGRVAIVTAVTSLVALRVILPVFPGLGARGYVGGILGVATGVGVSLGAVNVALTKELRCWRTILTRLAVITCASWACHAKQSELAATFLATTSLAATSLTTADLAAATLVAAVGFSMGAQKSPFHTDVNLKGVLLKGSVLFKGIGMETVGAAAAPLGAGALGAAVLSTGALGKLGILGVVLAVLLAVGKTLSDIVKESSEETNEHTE